MTSRHSFDALLAAIAPMLAQGRLEQALHATMRMLATSPDSRELHTLSLGMLHHLPLHVRLVMTTAYCRAAGCDGPVALVERLEALFGAHPDRYEMFASLGSLLVAQDLPELAVRTFGNALRPADEAATTPAAIAAEYGLTGPQYDDNPIHQATIDGFLTLLGESLEGRRDGLTIVDAACGTGLAAPVLRPMAARLIGLDLAPAMLARAEQGGQYDQLIAGDMVAAMAAMPDQADLVVCSGATYYLKDIGPFLAAARICLKPGGQLFFSDIPAPDGMGVMHTLGGTPRYCRDAALMRNLADRHGLEARPPVLERSFLLPAYHWLLRRRW